ncbi:amino acid permease-domain-containing protein [Abortiporus biennis]|nr:amino acid permease-domain-containing protein [Abortiporus biennis]
MEKQEPTKGTIQQADEDLLASLGYKQEFKRAFSGVETFGIAFSIIGLLPSIASVLFYSVPNGGPSAMVWGWAVASIFILFVGMSMAELASAAPTSGGLYFWTFSLASPKWRNLLAWIVGYANTIGSISAIASIDWGCAVQIMAAANIGSKDQSFVATDAQLFGVFACVIISHAIICCFGTAVLARLQSVYVGLNVLLCLAVIIALPAATPKEFRNTASYAFGNFTNTSGWPNGYAFILSFLAPLWTICSFDSSVHIAEEASNAAVAVPWAIVGAIGIAGILGWAINVALAFCMGTDLDAIMSSSQPMAAILFNAFGQKGTLAVWAIIVVCQYMMGSSMVLAASRQSFAFSRDGALPFSNWLYRMNKYTVRFTNSPTNSFKPGPFNLGRFSLPVAIIAVLWMLFMGIVFLFPATPGPEVPDMNYTIVVMGGVMFLSLVYYYFPKYGGIHWFKGPIPTIDDQVDGTTVDSLEKKGADVAVNNV